MKSKLTFFALFSMVINVKISKYDTFIQFFVANLPNCFIISIILALKEEIMLDNLSIRYATPHDSAALLSIYTPYVEHTAITFEYEIPTEDEFAHRIETTLIKYPYLIAELDGVIVGYAYACCFKNRPAYDYSVETSIYVNQSMKKSGIGKALYTALENDLKSRNILNMYACIAVPEIADEYLDRNSVDFHNHLGFKTVGEFHKCGYKFGRWYNMVWMEKMIGEHR